MTTGTETRWPDFDLNRTVETVPVTGTDFTGDFLGAGLTFFAEIVWTVFLVVTRSFGVAVFAGAAVFVPEFFATFREEAFPADAVFVALFNGLPVEGFALVPATLPLAFLPVPVDLALFAEVAFGLATFALTLAFALFTLLLEGNFFICNSPRIKLCINLWAIRRGVPKWLFYSRLH